MEQAPQDRSEKGTYTNRAWPGEGKEDNGVKLNKTFENEIKKVANGDGSREYKFAFISELKEVSAALENKYEFDGAMKKYGRAKVSICIAATIIRHADRHENTPIQWATAVMKLWTNICERSVSSATINIHPCILHDISAVLRRLTTE
jgi:hypothetical protein